MRSGRELEEEANELEMKNIDELAEMLDVEPESGF